jgi:flagellar protein FlbD
MITLNRLGHKDEPFQLNVDMIVTVESTPDTVITLATGTKVVVAETPAEVATAVHEFRASVLAEAFRRRGRAGGGRGLIARRDAPRRRAPVRCRRGSRVALDAPETPGTCPPSRRIPRSARRAP